MSSNQGDKTPYARTQHSFNFPQSSPEYGYDQHISGAQAVMQGDHAAVQIAPAVYPPGVAIIRNAPPPPETYLAWSIVSLVCCCFPLGIAAVVYSSAVNTAYLTGLYGEAQRKSNIARALNISATVVGVTIIVIIAIVGVELTSVLSGMSYARRSSYP